MEYDVYEGNGVRTELVSVEKDENYEDILKECRPKHEIICPKCLGSKYREKTGCSEKMCGHCTGCSRFYPMPKNLRDWWDYYWRRAKTWYYVKKHNLTYYWYKFFYDVFVAKKIYSIVGSGDVIHYRALWSDEGWNKHVDTMKRVNADVDTSENEYDSRDKIYELRIPRISVAFDRYNHNKPFYIKGDYTDINTQFFHHGDLGVDIVDINGEKKYETLLREFEFTPNWFSRTFFPVPKDEDF